MKTNTSLQTNNSTMKVKFIILILFYCQAVFSQTVISGKVTDKKGEPIVGVNIYLKGTYDGASTDADGNYKIKTELQGNQILVVSCIGYKTCEKEMEVTGGSIFLDIVIKESNSQLNAVVITAGSFEASDEKKSVIMKPLDIVTTAGGLADIPSAINTLPGTQMVGEEGKLFVRGGDSYETRTFIDGMIVDKPYESTTPDVPSRGRFSPFLFKGTIFSSGGYSAEYGQALSSALILQTTDLPSESVSGISLMSVGVGASHTQRWQKSSVSVSADYFNLTPYFNLFKQDFDWQEAPKGIGGSLSFRQKTGKDGLIKFYSQVSHGKSKLRYPNYMDVATTNDINLNDDNGYFNATYRDLYGKKWISNGGVSYTFNVDDTKIEQDEIKEKTKSLQFKYNLACLLSEDIKIKFGGDVWNRQFSQDYFDSKRNENFFSDFTDNISSVFVEAEFMINGKFAARVGGRAEYSSLLKESNLSPRISLAYKTGKKSQVSLAYGTFFQSPNDHYLEFNRDLSFEKATHYILNYQIIKNNRTFRIEVFYKDYKNLVKYDSLYLYDPSAYNNFGKGYARGIDIFWRDNSFGNHDYWISYSYIDTKRNYRDYPVSATPTFVSNHNLSVVYKHYISKISSQIGMTYRFASGRTYINPNNPDFLSDKTKAYNDLSFNLSYLTNLWGNFTIVYFSVNNILGLDNVFGYQYSLTPDSNGNYNSFAVTPGAKRFLFLGIFISL
ncbi:MAG: TonB-dependent receptor [Bacteroidetes bacterium]|nr:TonB-dependent receptor [Bacteroidota bacterium]MBL7103787.1 TonB-dependent receptor [Bacteroidales bacterium]